MYEYDVVTIPLKGTIKGKVPKEDYHEIIQNYAKEGWRLVQIFAPPIAGYGVATFYELIFERTQ